MGASNGAPFPASRTKPEPGTVFGEAGYTGSTRSSVPKKIFRICRRGEVRRRATADSLQVTSATKTAGKVWNIGTSLAAQPLDFLGCSNVLFQT